MEPATHVSPQVETPRTHATNWSRFGGESFVGWRQDLCKNKSNGSGVEGGGSLDYWNLPVQPGLVRVIFAKCRSMQT